MRRSGPLSSRITLLIKRGLLPAGCLRDPNAPEVPDKPARAPKPGADLPPGFRLSHTRAATRSTLRPTGGASARSSGAPLRRPEHDAGLARQRAAAAAAAAAARPTRRRARRWRSSKRRRRTGSCGWARAGGGASRAAAAAPRRAPEVRCALRESSARASPPSSTRRRSPPPRAAAADGGSPAGASEKPRARAARGLTLSKPAAEPVEPTRSSGAPRPSRSPPSSPRAQAEQDAGQGAGGQGDRDWDGEDQWFRRRCSASTRPPHAHGALPAGRVPVRGAAHDRRRGEPSIWRHAIAARRAGWRQGPGDGMTLSPARWAGERGGGGAVGCATVMPCVDECYVVVVFPCIRL